MRNIALFVEDHGHHVFVEGVVKRLAQTYSVQVQCKEVSVRGGYGKVTEELAQFVRDITRERVSLPDLLIVATDANCRGFNERKKELDAKITGKLKPFVVHAIPDPHVERWMLLDSGAFKTVFGTGCDSPDQKCKKDRYKDLLRNEITSSGTTPVLGGMEFAEAIVSVMDLPNAARQDKSFGSFVESLESRFKQWARGG